MEVGWGHILKTTTPYMGDGQSTKEVTMKQIITESQFVDEIVGDEYNSMSYEGARALYEYLEEMEDGGEEMTFCRVEIRCQYTEYENIEEALENYDDIKTLADLKNRTIVIEIPDSEKLIIDSNF